MAFDHEHKLIVKPERYRNNSFAIKVYEISTLDDDLVVEPFGNLTVNLDEPIQSETKAFVKIWSENASWAEQLARQIGTPTGVIARAGFCFAPLYEFDESKMFAE